MKSAVVWLAVAGLRGRSRWGLAASFVIVLLAATGVAAGLVVNQQGARALDAVAARADVAHLVVSGTADAVRQVTADPEVRAATGPVRAADAELVRSTPIDIQVLALDRPDGAVNRPPQRAGRWAASAEEVVVDRSFADDIGLAVGDSLQLRLGSVTATFTVAGTAVNLTDCFYPQCDPGRVWVTNAGLDRLAPGEAAYTQGWLRFDSPAQADPFVQRYARARLAGITGTDSWLDTRDDFLSFDRVFGAFVTAFGLFVLFVAAVVVAGSLAVRMIARRREVGLLGAVGCTPRQVGAALVLEHLLPGLLAAVAGWGLAGVLAPSLQFGTGAALGAQGPTWSVLGLAVAAGIVGTVLVLATLGPALAAARQPVTDVIRGVPTERATRRSRRTARLPRRLELLGTRELAGRPARAALAGLAVVVAVVGALVSVGFIDAIGVVAAEPARAGDPWDVTVAANPPGPASVEAALAATAGVRGWYSETDRRSTFHDGAFLSIAIGGDPAAAGFRIAGGRPMGAAGEAIAGYGFLQRFDVAVGDTVEFLAGTTPLSVRIVGWYRETEDSGEVLQYRMETLTAVDAAAAPNRYRVSVGPPDRPEQVAAALSERLGPLARTEVIDTRLGDLATVGSIMRLVAALLVAMAGLNLLTTLLTSNREAARRLGVCQTLGLTPAQLTAQGAVAGAAIGLGAVAIGLPAGLWLFRVLSDRVSASIGVGPGWMPQPHALPAVIIVVGALVLTASLGALAVVRLASRPASELVRWE